MTRRLVMAVVVVVGVALLAVGLFGLLGGDDSGSNASHKPTHRTDFDVRTEPLPTTTSPPTTVPVPAPAPRPIPVPVSVNIPDLGISSDLIPLGLNPDNTLEVPQDYSLAGWYTGRPVPGEVGPAVIAGHVDSKRGPGVFYRLKEVQPGTVIEVGRSDGTVARFSVVAKEQHDKDAFPTERVYGPTDSPELRLITCGGVFDRSVGHYNDNIVVFAELIEIV